VIAPPDEQARQIQQDVGVQMREQDIDGARIGVALQRTQHSAAEVEHHRYRVGLGQQISDAGESGPTTLPEQPSTVIRTPLACHVHPRRDESITAFGDKFHLCQQRDKQVAPRRRRHSRQRRADVV
jgi:hypothetical protein